MFSQHTFENSFFGTSEIDTPIEDPKLDGHFVERIRGSSRESSIGVLKNAGARAGPAPRGPSGFQRPHQRCAPHFWPPLSKIRDLTFEFSRQNGHPISDPR